MQIPLELLEQIEQDNVVLILGHDVNLGESGEQGSPTLAELARELAERAGYPDQDQNLPRVAQYYEMKLGRDDLISCIEEQLPGTATPPLTAHRILARLPFRAIVTTSFDNRLEQALREAGRSFATVIQNADIAYEDEDKLLVVKMHGSFEQPDSLILTEMDHRSLLDGVSSISDVLNRLIASHTLLLLGYDLDDDNFKDLYDRVNRRLDRHARRNYAFYREASTYAINWWKEVNHFHVEHAEPIAFLHELERLLGKGRDELTKPTIDIVEPVERPTISIPSRPYKFLNAYQEEDAAIFFGRDREKSRLLSKLVAYRLVLFYGKSGVGKTSLIKAGLMPALAASGYHPVYARILTDPQTAIIQAVNATLEAPPLEQPAPADTRAADEISQEMLGQKDRSRLRQILTTRFDEGELRTLCFDLKVDYDSIPGQGKANKARELIAYVERRGQVHELLRIGRYLRPDISWDIVFPTAEQAPAKQPSLCAYLRQVGQATKGLIVLFIDQFEELFTQVDPETRAAFLQDLGAVYADEQIKLKIVLSFREDFLAELNALAAVIPGIFQNYYRLEQLTMEQAREAIVAPAELCGFSYEPGLIDRVLADLGEHRIDPPQLQIVCDSLYEAPGPDERLITSRHYEQLGGAGTILAGYLDQVLKRYVSKQRAAIQELLKAFVTAADTGAVLTIEDLAQRARLSAEQVHKTLDELLRARLVRRAESETQYELAHEYLVDRIVSWMSDQEREWHRAQEMLEQGLRKWESFGLPLYLDEMVIVDAQRKDLEIDDTAEALLAHSAAWTGHNVDYWVERASPQLRAAALHNAIESDDAARRCRAARLAGRFAVQDLMETLADLMLADPDPTVRREAAISLARVDGDRFTAQLQEALEGPPERHQSALEAVDSIQEAALMGVDLGRLGGIDLQWKLRRLRLQRNRRQWGTMAIYSLFGGLAGGVLAGLLGTFFFRDLTAAATGMTAASLVGLQVGVGIGAGFGAVKAMQEPRNSTLYIMGAMLGGGLLGALSGISASETLETLLSAVGLGMMGGGASGAAVALIVNLTTRLTSPARRLITRSILALPGSAVTSGAMLYLVAQLGLAPPGTMPAYGFLVGVLCFLGIVVALDLAERQLDRGRQVDTGRQADHIT